MFSNQTIAYGPNFYRHIGTEYLYIGGCMTQPPASASGLTTVAPTFGNMRAVPFMSGRGGVIDRIAFNVTVAVASSVARVGIYTATSAENLYPDSLVIDGGEHATSSIGAKTATISQPLQPNTLYWFVHLGGVGSPTILGLGAGSCMSLLGRPSTLGANTSTNLTVAQTYGALPASFPSGAAVASSTIPLIVVRYSA